MDHAVAAAGLLAIVATAVAVVGIAVVAGFVVALVCFPVSAIRSGPIPPFAVGGANRAESFAVRARLGDGIAVIAVFTLGLVDGGVAAEEASPRQLRLQRLAGVVRVVRGSAGAAVGAAADCCVTCVS